MSLVPFKHRSEKINPENRLHRVDSVLKSHEEKGHGKQNHDSEHSDEFQENVFRKIPSGPKHFRNVRKPYQLLGIPEKHYFLKSIWTPRIKTGIHHQLENILVAIDGRGSSYAAIKTALHLTEKFQAKAWTVKASSKKENASTHFLRKEQLKSELLKSFHENDFKQFEIEYTYHNDPCLYYMNFSQRKRCSIILCSPFAKWESPRSIFSQNVHSLIEEATCPILLLPKSLEKISKILVPISHHPSTFMTITQALVLAKIYHSSVQLLHISESNEKSLKEIQELHKILNHIQWQGIQHELICQTGKIVMEINRYLRQEYTDLVILNSDHNESFSSSSRPKITSELIHQCPVPALIIQSPFG